MDKKTIIIALFLLSSLIGSAQKFSGGFFLSPSLTWMKPDISKNISNEGLKLGFSYGALGDLNIIGENFSFLKRLIKNNDLAVNFITRNEDEFCWKFSNKGYFNFKSNIPIILSTFKLN